MEDKTIIDKVKALTKPLFEEEGTDLVEIVYRREGRQTVLRFLVDKHSGITLDECAHLNEKISAILDKEDIMATSYILEVSSPGLDRPLTTKEDFGRVIGKRMEIFLKVPLKGRLSYVGRLKEVKEDSITLELEKVKYIDIPLDIVNKGKLKIHFVG